MANNDNMTEEEFIRCTIHILQYALSQSNDIPPEGTLIPQSSVQTSPGMFTGNMNNGYEEVNEESEANNNMDIDNLGAQNQASENNLMTINNDTMNEEEFIRGTMYIIEYALSQSNDTPPLENSQARIFRDLINEAVGITSMDVDYPSTQNDENQAFEDKEMTLGRHVENEQYNHYTEENVNDQEQEVTMLESLMNEEHQSKNSSCTHPSGTVNHEFEENKASEQVAAMNKEYDATTQANVSTVLTKLLEAVDNQNDHSGLQGIPDNVDNESHYGEVHNESHEGNSKQEHEMECVGSFHDNKGNFETAGEP